MESILIGGVGDVNSGPVIRNWNDDKIIRVIADTLHIPVVLIVMTFSWSPQELDMEHVYISPSMSVVTGIVRDPTLLVPLCKELLEYQFMEDDAMSLEQLQVTVWPTTNLEHLICKPVMQMSIGFDSKSIF